jgi:capsular exopolysaccharide synthesis family protein
VEEAMNTAKMLQKRLAATPKQSLPQVCSEVLGFLTVQKDNGAPFLTGELSRLIAESHRLEGQYDNTHPIVVKNQAEIRQTIEKVTLELQNFIEELKQRETEQQTQISALSQKIHALPSEELNLSELTRLQQIKADIYARLLDKFYQSSVSDVTEIPDFYVMDYAAPPMPPPSGLDRKVLLMCFFFTLFVLFGPMVAVDFLSKTVRTEVELKKLLGVDILESIPRITLKKGASGRSPSNGLSNTLIINEENFAEDYVKELFRLLRTKIMFRLHGSAAARAIVISSLESNVGKSTIASNIAIAMAQQNLKTVLVDGDLRLGTIHHLFNLEKSPGLSEFLNNDRTDKPVPISIHHPGAIPNLSVITSGEYLANAGELVASDRMRSLIRTLTGKYDMVIFDSPPISIVADALTVDALFSHYLLVVRAGRTNVVDLREKIAEHAQLKSKLMGVVLNFASIDRKMHYYKQSKYYFQGQQKTGA